nr:efflux RND transporter permease subunit [Brevibacillus fulvus]
MLVALIVVIGFAAVARVDLQNYPAEETPVYLIHAVAPGMPADYIDEKVRKPLEQAIRQLGEFEHLSTLSRDGQAELTVQRSTPFPGDYGQRLDKKLAEIAPALPGGRESVRWEQVPYGDRQIAYLLLQGNDLQTAWDAAAHTVRETLQQIPGVARVELEQGAVQQRVEVLLQPAKLKQYGLTPEEVSEQLQRQHATARIGEIGTDDEKTSLQWTSQPNSPQEWGNSLIATREGYVALKQIAIVQDKRASRGETVSLYQGEPFVGVRVYAEEHGQEPKIRNAVRTAVDLLNEQANGTFRLIRFPDEQLALASTLQNAFWLVGLAVSCAAFCVGWRFRQLAAGLLFGGAVGLALLALLGGIWLGGIAINIATLGALLFFAVWFVGAGTALFHQLTQLADWNLDAIAARVKRTLQAMLLALVIVFLLVFIAVYSDWLSVTDRATLLPALPLFGWGALSMIIVYGVILPAYCHKWLSKAPIPRAVRPVSRWAQHQKQRWSALMRKGYLPYVVSLSASLLLSFFFQPFVTVDPFLQLDTHEMHIRLPMIKGSSLDQAIAAERQAEQQLRQIKEIQELQANVSKELIRFEVRFKDRYDWEQSKPQLEKTIEQTLRQIPGTDPYELAIDGQTGSIEFTVKGPALQTTGELANQVLAYLQNLRWVDKQDREIITDERISTQSSDVPAIQFRPKREMLARYQISEEEIRDQLAFYLQEQQIGDLLWNGSIVPVIAKFPEMAREHPEQVKKFLIRTAEGTVPLAELAEAELGPPPAEFMREDGLYVMKVSAQLSEPSRRDTLSYYLPYQFRQEGRIPPGYTIQTADETEKEQQEEADQADWPTRLTVTAIACLIALSLGSAFGFKVRHVLLGLLLLPVLSGAVILALLALYRPYNLMAFYGVLASCGLILQQALPWMDSAARRTLNRLEQRVFSHAPATIGLLGSVLLGLFPMAMGMGQSGDYSASFAAALGSGVILAGWCLLVLLPALLGKEEQRAAAVDPSAAAEFRRWLRTEWSNYLVKRRDRAKQADKLDSLPSLAQSEQSGRVCRELTEDDFRPLSRDS